MNRIRRKAILLVVAPFIIAPSTRGIPKEFLTPKEISQVQVTHEIDKRIKLYLDAAAMRLQSAQERLSGKESEQGDPLEFFSVEDMMDGYNRIMESVMMNLDDAYQKPAKDGAKLRGALKSLKESTDRSEKRLMILKKLAEDKVNEQLWNLVNQAMEITKGAREGSDFGLAQIPEQPAKKRGR
jgi:hypothetical protein